MSKEFPVSETLKVLKGLTLYKTEKWWSAIVLMESFGKKQIAVYLWGKKGDEWKRRQKFVVRSKSQWVEIKEAMEKLLPEIM